MSNDILNTHPITGPVTGGVDTHKDLHVAAVVDGNDQFLASKSFATTRQGYRQMLTWMQSFGDLGKVGVESTGTYGAGLLRYLLKSGIDVLEVCAFRRTLPLIPEHFATL